jgi:hypothetical protein
MKKGTKLNKLSPEDIEAANDLGIQRQLNNRKHKTHYVAEGRMGSKEDTTEERFSREQRGVRSEFAFARNFDCLPESWDLILAIGVQSAVQGSDPADAIVQASNGKKLAVDVKTTEYYTGNLLVSLEKRDCSCVFVLLVEGSEGEFTFAGAITSQRAFALLQRGVVQIRSRNTIWIPQVHLNDFTPVIEFASTLAP